jgi:hypothetical protein
MFHPVLREFSFIASTIAIASAIAASVFNIRNSSPGKRNEEQPDRI